MLVIVRTLSLFTSQPRNVHSIHTIHMYRMHLTIITYVLTHVQLFRYTRTHVGTNYVVRTLLVSHTRDKIHNRSDHGVFLQNNSISRIEVLKNTYVRMYSFAELRAHRRHAFKTESVLLVFNPPTPWSQCAHGPRQLAHEFIFKCTCTDVHTYVRIYIRTHIYSRTYARTYVRS